MPDPTSFEDAVNEALAEKFGDGGDAVGDEPAAAEPEGIDPDVVEEEVDDDPDGSAEDDDEDGDDTGDGDGPEPLQVGDDAVLQLPDGSTKTVRELREGFLRQSDYTRKTQELADQRRDIEGKLDAVAEWYEERAGNPVGWVQEIISSMQDPTATLAQAIVSLAEATRDDGTPLLDPEFVKTFGITSGPVAQKSVLGQTEERIARLEREREEERREAEAAQLRQQAVAEYQRQYREIVDSEGLTFASPEEEMGFKQQLVAFANEHQITDLRVAHDAMQRRQELQQRTAERKKAEREAAETVAARKKATGAMARKAGTSPAPERASSFEEAALEAVAELQRQGRI